MWYSRLFGVERENTLSAHDITYAGHYQKSLLRNDSRCYLCNMKIISSDWIALLRRSLIDITITCVIVRSNPRRLFSSHASSNAGHYQSKMTTHNDPRTWCYERKVRFLLKRQTSARTTPRTRAFNTLSDDRHVWTDRNSLTGIDTHWVQRKFSKVILHKLNPEMHVICLNSGY